MAAGALATLAIVVGAWLGLYGPLHTCGADAAAVCVAWPAALSVATWLLFCAFFIALGAWQIRQWRRSVNAVAPDEHVAQDG